MVLDPFLGSGTVLGECARLGLGGIGTEVNHAAVVLARVYELANFPLNVRSEALTRAMSLATRWLNTFNCTALGDQPVTIPSQSFLQIIKNEHPSQVRSLLEAVFVLSDPQPEGLNPSKVISALKRLQELVLGFPHTTKKIKVLSGDARRLPVEDSSIDFVLTSPPYINVFNYHQQYRQAVEQLGGDVLTAARSEIGANRKHRSNRLLTVIQYCIDMTSVLHELERVTRFGSRIIFVIGRESRVRGLPIYNGDLLHSLAQQTTSLKMVMRQEREFVNRFGERIFEDILHFDQRGVTAKEKTKNAVSVARSVLKELLIQTHGDVRTDLEAALSTEVSPSPIFKADI